MLKRISLMVIFLQIFFVGLAFAQNQNSSSEEEAIKSVIMNETKSWADGNYERWSDAWVQEKYVFRMYSGPDSYMEILSWDSVAAGIKADFKSYSRPLNIDFTWTDWSIRIFKDCAWVSYIETFRYKEKQYNYREVRFLEKKDELWKIVYLAAVNTTLYNERKESAENDLNSAGYNLLSLNKIKDAIDIFKKNVELYPKSSNVYDSLGEAYMKNGDKELAIQNYQKSLELDPNNENAKEMLKKLAEK